MSTKRNDTPAEPPPRIGRDMLSPPPFPGVPLPSIDARTHALRVFRQWLASLRYMRTMSPTSPAQEFAIEEDHIFIEQPDNVEGVDFPSIGILPARGQYESRGLGGADPDDDTTTVDGLALLVPYDYSELIAVEGWGSKIAERRAIVAAIEVAIGCSEGSTDLRLRMDDYFGLAATFSLMERENIEDLETPRGRRRVHLFVQMRVPVVAAARFGFLDANPGGGIAIALDMGNGTLAEGLGASSLVAAAGATTPEAALSAMGLTILQAKAIARATYALTPAEADALTPAYLVQMCLVLAKENASLETWYGRPPYQPGETEAQRVLRDLPRYKLP